MRDVRLARGEPPKMTALVIEIFRVLSRYRYLRTQQIYDLIPAKVRPKKYKHFVFLLGRLYDHSYLNRPPGRKLNFNYRNAQEVHELDDKGRHELKVRAIHEPYNTLNARRPIGAQEDFPHAMMAVDTMFAIERGVNGDPNAILHTWGEIMDQAPAATFSSRNPFAFPAVSIKHWYKHDLDSEREEPKLIDGTAKVLSDIIVSISYRRSGGDVLYPIECENGNPLRRSNLSDNSALKKMLAYRELRRLNLFEKHLGYRAVIPLFVFSDEDKVQAFLNLIMYETKGQGSTMFAATHLPLFGSTPEANPTIPDLYKGIGWKRAGYPDLHLNDPK